ncbi:MAG TPA: dinitrogenase iron-molybdenum cofactor biosynthesis protein [Syntrophaceticus sp.]|nr:dinitrogenase iron-molybdenum cofactor biosynthesis protein [Syntrophaceticus sp.]
MRIGISAAGKDLDALLDPRFGRCPYFLIVDTETKEFEAVDNPGSTAGGGAGIKAAQAFLRLEAKELVTGQAGPNAFEVLVEGGVKIYQAPQLKISEVIELYKNGDLKETTPAGRGRGAR